ncbi:MAG: PEP-CTERM sorting domain-containing protein [Pirellulales bacterium]
MRSSTNVALLGRFAVAVLPTRWPSRTAIATGCVILLAAQAVKAAPVIVNAGFESPDVPDASLLWGPMTDGWFFSGGGSPPQESAVVDPGGLSAFDPYNVTPAEGEQFALIDKGYIEQSISGLVIGIQATLNYSVTGSSLYDSHQPEEYRVLINGAVLASLTTTTYNAFVTHSLNFTPATTTVLVRFEALDPLEDPIDPEEFPEDEPDLLLLDNIAIQQVPEPSTLLLIAIGIAGLLARRRSR